MTRMVRSTFARAIACAPARALAPMALAVLALAAAAGCGGSGNPDNPGVVPPPNTVCVPLGFGSVEFGVTCPPGSGGADHQCTFVFTSSNAGVVAISPSTVTLQENTSQRVFMTTIGNSAGTARLDGDSDNGPPFFIGNIRVGC